MFILTAGNRSIDRYTRSIKEEHGAPLAAELFVLFCAGAVSSASDRRASARPGDFFVSMSKGGGVGRLKCFSSKVCCGGQKERVGSGAFREDVRKFGGLCCVGADGVTELIGGLCAFEAGKRCTTVFRLRGD